MIIFLFCQKISFFYILSIFVFSCFFEYIKKYKYFNILFFDVFSSIFTCIINRIPGKMMYKAQCQDLYPYIRACHQDIWGHVHVSIICYPHTTLTPLTDMDVKDMRILTTPDIPYMVLL